MRAILCVVLLALAGCADGSTDADPAKSGSQDNDESTNGQPTQPGSGEEPIPGIEDSELVVLAVVDCPLTDIQVYLGGAGVRDVTSTRCLFEDLAVPDGAVAFNATFTWGAAWAEGDMGIRVSDQTRCDVDGGDGCDLGNAVGASPVVLELDADAIGTHEIKDLDIYPVGFAVEPEWSLQIAFFGYT